MDPSDFEIRLECGLDVRLECLFQYRTYSGLLEGLPSRDWNAKLIARAVQYATEKLWNCETPHLLTPPEVSLGVPREKWFRPDDGWEPASLPPIVCLATFDSFTPVRDPSEHGSSLDIVWFQGQFGPPSEPTVLEQFRAIDWRSLARDWSY